MDVLTHIPRQPLAEFVECLWLHRRALAIQGKELLLPTGTVELVVDLSANSTDPLICGAYSKPFTIDTAEPATIVGVHFKPGGAVPFLGAPLGEFTNGQIPLRALWGTDASALVDALLEAKTPDAKFRTLEKFLMRHGRLHLGRHPALDFAIKTFQGEGRTWKMAEVIEHVGLSPRRFIQLFTDRTGLTPKLFCRILRFQQALRLIGGRTQVNWAEVSTTCGYYDQSHLIHDFQAFANLNPTAYLHMRGERPNHIPLRV